MLGLQASESKLAPQIAATSSVGLLVFSACSLRVRPQPGTQQALATCAVAHCVNDTCFHARGKPREQACPCSDVLSPRPASFLSSQPWQPAAPVPFSQECHEPSLENSPGAQDTGSRRPPIDLLALRSPSLHLPTEKPRPERRWTQGLGAKPFARVHAAGHRSRPLQGPVRSARGIGRPLVASVAHSQGPEAGRGKGPDLSFRKAPGRVGERTQPWQPHARSHISGKDLATLPCSCNCTRQAGSSGSRDPQ